MADNFAPSRAAILEHAAELDRGDALAFARERFLLPEGVTYLDGNSLGCLTRAAQTRVAQAVREEWGRGLISSWNKAGWVNLPARVGNRIGTLIGAPAGSVVACDSTSVNLFKLLAAAVRARPGRSVILSERANFPTDLYMAEGLARLIGEGHTLRLVDRADEIEGALTPDVAVLMLTHVNYRTGAMHDMRGLTAAAHRAGALTVWDLAHSAGAVPVDLTASDADFALGCGYKYLNGGPGAPAFLFVAPPLQNAVEQPLSGWFGHAAPFAFDAGYAPADGIARFLTGTPSVVALSALDAALSAFDGIAVADLYEKSKALTSFFVDAAETLCAGHDLQLAGPRDAALRGSQVSFAHYDAYALCQALIERGIVGDFRAPDLVRFGFAPLYTRFADAAHAAVVMAEILDAGAHRDARFGVRNAVT